MYKVSKYGLRAIENKVFQKQSPKTVELLSEILNSGSAFKSFQSVEDQNQIGMLVELGLLTQPDQHENSDQLNQQQDTSNSVHAIKRDIVDLVKRDLQHHDKFWDVLLNLESVNNKDGLLWFMSQVTDLSGTASQKGYKALFEALAEQENG